MNKAVIFIFLFLQIGLSFGQVFVQTQTDAVIGTDRKNWNGGSTVFHSQGYAHDFTLPAMMGSCQKITKIDVQVSITNYVNNSPPGCTPGNVYVNMYYGCGTYSGGASCNTSNLIGEPNYNPGAIVNTFNYSYNCPLNGTGLEADFGGNFSVDIVPIFTPGCNPNWNNAINSGFVAYTYSITVTVTVQDKTCNGTGCLAGTKTMLPCDDGNACTINDVQTILDCDGSICLPCAGVPSGTPPTPTFTQLGPYCQNTTAGTFALSSNNSPPINGTWSPPVINTSAVGTQVYTFTPSAGECGTSTTMSIVTTAPPTPTFTQLGPYCQNTTPGTLPASSNNAPSINGTWSPPVINTSAVGSQLYTFTPSAGECGSTATMSITTTSPPTPIFTQLGPYCQNTTPGTLPLSSNNSPAITGTWSPAVVNTAVVGTQVYTFTPAAGQCGSTVTMSITITSPPTPTFTQLGPYCQNTTAGTLPLLSNNSTPINGTWSPPIINTSSVGVQVYTFTPAAGQCGSTATMSITITSPPTPTFTQLGPYCQNTSPDLLPTSSNNFPPINGTWSPAVINTSAVGTEIYTFTPNAGECGETTTMTITIAPSITPAFTQLGPYCQNSTPATLPINSNNSPSITGTWSPATINTSVVGNTIYTFTPTSGQCILPATMEIVINDNVPSTFTQLGPFCLNTTPALLPSSSTNSPPIAGSWSPAIINTSAIGNTLYTFTPSTAECALPATMTIEISTSVPSTFNQIGPYCLNETPVALPLISTNTPSVTGTWSPPIINTSAIGSTIYTFTPSAGQCGTTTTMTITVSSPPLSTFTQLGPYCLNAVPAVLPSTSNNVPSIAGSWTPSIINTSTIGSTVYTFTPNANQCGLPTTMTIEVSNSVIPSFNPIGPYCLNAISDPLPVSSLNGIMGTWSPSTISTSTIGSVAYTFTPNAGQCGSPTTINIEVKPSLTPSFTTLGPYCVNDTPGLLPSNSNNTIPIPGTWSPSTINTSSSGTSIYIFNPSAGQCAVSATMSVVVSNRVTPTFAQVGPYCLNATPDALPTISNNAVPITGTWSPTTINTSSLGTTIYTFTPSPGQCGNTTTMTVTIASPPVPAFAQLGPYCLNATAGVLPTNSNNTIPISGTWSPATINTSAIGTTIYTFTPSPGQCALPTTMTVTVANSVTPSFNQLGPYCISSTPGTLPIASINGVSGTWSPSIINTSTIGTTIYTFTPSIGQCGNVTTMTIEIIDALKPTFTQLGPYCLNATPDVLPAVSNNTVPINGTWSPAVINTSAIGSTVYTFTPSNGQCASPSTMTIEIGSSITPSFDQLGPFCVNTVPGTLPGASLNGISGTWSPASISTSTIGSVLYTFTPSIGQCGKTSTMTINITDAIIPTFVPLGPYCLNATPSVLPTISNNGLPITGTWSPSAINTSILGSTIYTFTPSNGQCALPTTVTVEVSSSIVPDFLQLGPYCLNEKPDDLILLSINGIQGVWSPTVINTLKSGTTKYTFTPSGDQCGEVLEMDITIYDNVSSVETEISDAKCRETNGALVIKNVENGTPPYSFNFNNLGLVETTTFSNLAGGTYPLTVVDDNGCTYNTSITIGKADCDATSGWVPNVFSPNGDGFNDELKIYIGSDIKIVKKFEIYDRWGSKLFSQSNIENNESQTGWTGNYNGNRASPGVYIYVAEIELVNGKLLIQKGDITLVR